MEREGESLWPQLDPVLEGLAVNQVVPPPSPIEGLAVNEVVPQLPLQ